MFARRKLIHGAPHGMVASMISLITAAVLLCAVYEDKWGHIIEDCDTVLRTPVAAEKREFVPDTHGGGSLLYYRGELKYIYIRDN